MFDEPAIRDADDVHELELNMVPGRRQTPQLTAMRATQRLPRADQITLGDLLVDLHRRIGKPAKKRPVKHLESARGPFPTWECRGPQGDSGSRTADGRLRRRSPDRAHADTVERTQTQPACCRRWTSAPSQVRQSIESRYRRPRPSSTGTVEALSTARHPHAGPPSHAAALANLRPRHGQPGRRAPDSPGIGTRASAQVTPPSGRPFGRGFTGVTSQVATSVRGFRSR